MPGRGVVELAAVREPSFGELPAHDPGERGNEFAFGHALRARPDQLLRCSDGERGLEPALVVPDGVADADEVDVVIDDAGDDGVAAQVDDLDLVAEAAHAA